MNSNSTAANATFDRDFRSGQEKSAQATEAGFGALTKSLQDIIALQTGEIERLRQLIESGAVPARHPEEIAVASYMNGTREKCDVIVKANDKALWLLPNAPRSPYAVPRHEGWVRLPPLPQAADEMNKPTSPNDEEE